MNIITIQSASNFLDSLGVPAIIAGGAIRDAVLLRRADDNGSDIYAVDIIGVHGGEQAGRCAHAAARRGSWATPQPQSNDGALLSAKKMANVQHYNRLNDVSHHQFKHPILPGTTFLVVHRTPLFESWP